MWSDISISARAKWVLLAYVLIGSAFAHLLTIPEIVKSGLSLPTWLIIPYFCGELVKSAFHPLGISSHSRERSAILSLFLGIYSLVVGSFLLDLMSLQVITKNLHFVILTLTFVSLIYETLRRHTEKPSAARTLSRADIVAIAFCLLASSIPASLSRSVFPFPYGTIEVISIPFEQYQPAIRFMENGYLQHFRVYDYVLLGFCSQLFNIDPLSFIWTATFLMMAIYSLGFYIFAFSVSRNRVVALLAALVGSFLNMNVFRDTPTLFKSNVFLYIFFAPALYLSYQSISRKRYKTKDVILTLLLLGTVVVFYTFMMNSEIWRVFVPANLQSPEEWWSHVWIPSTVVSTAPLLLALVYLSKSAPEGHFLRDNAPLMTLIIFLYIALINPENIAFIFFILAFVGIFCATKNTRTRLLLYIFVAGVLIFVLFQHYAVALPVLNPISSIFFPSFASPLDAISFSSRFEWLFTVNLTKAMSILFIVGVFTTAVSYKRENLLMISGLSLALLLYFFPETFSYRVYREISLMMAYVISFGLWSVFKRVLSPVNRRRKYVSFVVSTLAITLLVPNLIVPVYQRHYESLLGKSMTTDYEYTAARWLLENAPENTLLISDFSTMELLAPLSNKMLPIGRMYLIRGLSVEDLQFIKYIKDKLSPTYVSRDLGNGSSLSWTNYEWGEGQVQVLTEHIDQGEANNESQKIEVIPGDYSWVGIVHKIEKEQDWSNASSIYLHWFGRNTGNEWQVLLVAPDDLNYFYFDFYDDFSGWREIAVKLSEFHEVGNPSWQTTSYIAIRSRNPNYESWHLGSIGLKHVDSLNITYSDVRYLEQKIDTTDSRYCQYLNIACEKNPILIILTARTIKWIEQKEITEEWYPIEGPVDPTYVELFRNCALLEHIYSQEGKIYIFRVKT